MDTLAIVGYGVLALAVLGILFNLKDIRRYIHMTRM
jgi:hypothetical protein